jgi:hypothetical protein
LLDFVGSTLVSRGRLTNRWVEDGRTHGTCQVWIEDQMGAIGTTGSATVILPE